MYMYYIYVSEISFDFNSMDMLSINWYMYNHKVFTVMFICIQYLLTFYGTYMNVF